MPTNRLVRLLASVAIAISLSAGLACGGAAMLAPFSQAPPPSGPSPAPPPASGDTTSITVTSPSNGATVPAPVRFLASGGNGIVAMHLYVDDKDVYSSSNRQLETTQQLELGNHSVVVQGWDNSGTVHRTSLNITVVTGGSPMPSTDGNNFWNVQA